jgi:hypothetical protein
LGYCCRLAEIWCRGFPAPALRAARLESGLQRSWPEAQRAFSEAQSGEGQIRVKKHRRRSGVKPNCGGPKNNCSRPAYMAQTEGQTLRQGCGRSGTGRTLGRRRDAVADAGGDSRRDREPWPSDRLTTSAYEQRPAPRAAEPAGAEASSCLNKHRESSADEKPWLLPTRKGP